jgi:hypothetical protein
MVYKVNEEQYVYPLTGPPAQAAIYYLCIDPAVTILSV